MPYWEGSDYDSIYNQISPAYQGWTRAQALSDFYQARGGKLENLPAGYGDRYRASQPSYSQPAQSTYDPVAIAKAQAQAAEINRQNLLKANEPVIQSLRETEPEIASKYAKSRETVSGRLSNLDERYNNVINEIRGKGTAAVQSQTKVTANELAMRGIDPTSTLYNQELINAVNPIEQSYASLVKGAETERGAEALSLQELLGNLTAGETESLRALRNSIAQILASSSSEAINQAIQQYQTGEGSRQFDVSQALQQAQLAEQKRQSEIAAALQQRQLEETMRANQAKETLEKLVYQNINLPQVQYQTSKPYYKSSGGGGGWE